MAQTLCPLSARRPLLAEAPVGLTPRAAAGPRPGKAQSLLCVHHQVYRARVSLNCWNVSLELWGSSVEEIQTQPVFAGLGDRKTASPRGACPAETTPHPGLS